MKYEVPYIEIVKFEFKNILAAVSNGGFAGDENTGGFNNGEVEGDDDYDPFA